MRWLQKRSYYVIGRVPTTSQGRLRCRVINGRRAAAERVKFLLSYAHRFVRLVARPLPPKAASGRSLARRWMLRVEIALHALEVGPKWNMTPQPEDESYVGHRATWVGQDSIWCRTPGDEPDTEVSPGTEGTVTEFVAADPAGSRVYRIRFDNGALFTVSLPTPWAVELTPPA